MDEIWESLTNNSNHKDDLINWRSLKPINMFTLLRIFEQTDVVETELLYGFTYNQIKSIPLYSVKDARNVGPGRLKLLVNELNSIFTKDPNELLSPKVNSPNLESTSDADENNLYLKLINAKTLAEFDEFFVESLQLFVFNKDKEIDVVLHRADWSHKPKQTLEEIGKRLGVTRERVRQIENKQRSVSYPIPDDINTLNVLNHIFITSSSFEEYYDQFNEFEVNYLFNNSPSRFVSLANFLGKPSIADSFSKQIEKWITKQAELDTVKVSISKYRNQLGLIDLFAASVSLGLGEDSLFKLVKELYPRSLRINNLVLARTERHNTIFESTIYRQLLVSSVTPLIEIKVGLERVAKYRGQELTGHPSDVLELITILAGDPCKREKLLANIVQGSGLSNHEQWLVNLFTESKYGILHRNDIVEVAIQDGVAIGSVNQYLSTSPILRPNGQGIYSLVNQKVLTSTFNEYARQSSQKTYPVIRKLTKEQDVSYYHIIPNLAFIASGAVIANSLEKSFFGELVFTVSCSCNNLKSNQKVRITSDGFFIGLSSLLHHGIQIHNFDINSQFKMKIDKTKLLIKLEVD